MKHHLSLLEALIVLCALGSLTYLVAIERIGPGEYAFGFGTVITYAAGKIRLNGYTNGRRDSRNGGGQV